MSDATETPAVAEAAAVKRTKTRTKYDHATKTITVHEPHAAPVGYSMEELQPEMLHQLAVRGAAVYLTSAQDGHAAAWGRLTKGEYSQRKPAVEKPMSDWRLAIAHAAVEDHEEVRGAADARSGQGQGGCAGRGQRAGAKGASAGGQALQQAQTGAGWIGGGLAAVKAAVGRRVARPGGPT